MQSIGTFWNIAATAAAGLEVVASTPARTLGKHAPGARITVV